MEEQEKIEGQEKEEKKENVKTPWQLQKERWYDHVPLTVKQLDIIIWTAVAALVVVWIIIGLDAAGVF